MQKDVSHVLLLQQNNTAHAVYRHNADVLIHILQQLTS